MLIKKKVLFLFICITLLSLMLSGCYDLGDATETDEEYCELYPEIKVFYGSDDVDSYDMEDFYNKEAVNDFISPMDEDDRHYYSYLTIKVAEDISVGSFAVHFDSTEAETLSVSYFVLDESELPTKIYTGKDGTYKLSESDEPDPANAIGESSCKLAGVADKWQAAMLTAWKDGETTSKRHNVSGGQYIVLRLNNNCYDPALSDFETAEETWQKAKDEYDEKLAAYQAVVNDSESSQAERNAAMNELSQATAFKNLAERDYETSRQKYEKNKFPYKKVSVRVTAILINAK
ncbi:MAG: hypothetical protein IJ735_06360 [Clostridia bacterium]|nr:hypothetical protein [Clostridia bacterium]